MDILQKEKPLVDLFQQIEKLRHEIQHETTQNNNHSENSKKLHDLEKKFDALGKEIFSNLSPYETAQISRHPNRPYTLDIISQLCSNFIELHGDRQFMDDAAIVAGIGIFRNERVVLIGHQKGRGTKENVKRNFGMPKPEGYRKALRVMNLAEQFKLPIVTFIDTPGAYPGRDAEEHNQSEAIAKNIMTMTKLTVPIVSVVVGEGGSGGALAIGVANRVLMMEYATYSVISPEGCASILWKDGSQADRAASVLGLTAKTALKNNLIDEIVPEHIAAHWQKEKTIEGLGNAIEKHLKALLQLSPDECKNDRLRKIEKFGETMSKPKISPFSSPTPVVSSWGLS